MFFGPIGKTRWPPWPLIGRDIFDFSSGTTEPKWNLIGGKISMPSTKFVFFGPIGKTKWPPWPLIGWDIFDFSLETTEIQQNLTGSKLSMPSTTFVFSGKSGKNNIAALASDWLRHFRLLLWNCERNSTKLDRKQDLNALYQVCVFQVDRKKQNGRPGLWFAETFSTFPLKPLNRIQQNLTGSKISTSSTRLGFFRLIRKTR